MHGAPGRNIINCATFPAGLRWTPPVSVTAGGDAPLSASLTLPRSDATSERLFGYLLQRRRGVTHLALYRDPEPPLTVLNRSPHALQLKRVLRRDARPESQADARGGAVRVDDLAEEEAAVVFGTLRWRRPANLEGVTRRVCCCVQRWARGKRPSSTGLARTGACARVRAPRAQRSLHPSGTGGAATSTSSPPQVRPKTRVGSCGAHGGGAAAQAACRPYPSCSVRPATRGPSRCHSVSAPRRTRQQGEPSHTDKADTHTQHTATGTGTHALHTLATHAALPLAVESTQGSPPSGSVCPRPR